MNPVFGLNDVSQNNNVTFQDPQQIQYDLNDPVLARIQQLIGPNPIAPSASPILNESPPQQTQTITQIQYQQQFLQQQHQLALQQMQQMAHHSHHSQSRVQRHRQSQQRSHHHRF